MLSTIRIQNFKSLRDVTLDLKQINLLIGPNNSGKSNLLKALEFFSTLLHSTYKEKLDFTNLLYGRKEIFITKSKKRDNNPMAFTFTNVDDLGVTVFRTELYELYRDVPSFSVFAGLSLNRKIEDLNFQTFDFNFIDDTFYSYLFKSVNNNNHIISNQEIKNKDLQLLFNKNSSNKHLALYKHSEAGDTNIENISEERRISFYLERFSTYGFHDFISSVFEDIIIYKPDPYSIVEAYPITGDEHIKEDAGNLVSFFDRMKDINVEVINAINKDLNECIPEFKDIRLDTIKQDSPDFKSLNKLYNRDTFKKFGVSDKNGNIFWAEELSEGALYFIAILAIIHQPNPPKLLLLEEPEKGIHPRRIKEIIKYIQKLADDKGIQVIMTTHSPLVLDEFAHDPESIFVFDKENGETKIQNLQTDIIYAKNEVLKQKGISPIDYQENLGENWLMGLLNGVPND